MYPDDGSGISDSKHVPTHPGPDREAGSARNSFTHQRGVLVSVETTASLSPFCTSHAQPEPNGKLPLSQILL